MLTDIIGEFTGGITERIGELLGGDPATTEQAIDASVPAVVAGLGHTAETNADAVHAAVTSDDVADEALLGLALGDGGSGEGMSGVVSAIAGHVGVSAAAMAAALVPIAGVVGSFLSDRVAEADLDSAGLAALLVGTQSELDENGLAPTLASWGIPSMAPTAHQPDAQPTPGDGTTGQGAAPEGSSPSHDDDAGRPNGLWWLTGIITIVLFAIAISQCGGSATGAGGATFESADATTATTVSAPSTDEREQAASADDNTDGQDLGLLADLAAGHGQLNTLVNLADEAGLTGTLVGDDQFTIFAPTDEAFAALPADVLGALADNPDVLEALLLAHISEGTVMSSDLLDASSVTMLSGDVVEVGVDDEISIGGSIVAEADLVADNGVIHVVDAVIVPEGFEMPGQSAGADVIAAAESAGGFTTLLAALDAAGLTDVLEGEGPFTVFGPDDDAFAALPGGTVDALLERSDDLEAVLTYHVVEGEYLASDLSPGTQLTTLEGETLIVGGSGSTLEVGRAEVVIRDVMTGNGVIHVTDAVLLPRSVFPSGEPTINYVLALQPITFATASATITQEGQDVLDLAVAYLLENPVPVEIQGHTDSDGDESANQTLSEARAQSVLDYLVSGGVDEDLLTAVGFGETQPVADNETDEGKAQNRRIDFRVTG